MPELPEVETIRRGLEPLLLGRRLLRTQVRERRLREPVRPAELRRLEGAAITAVGRRSKYLLIHTSAEQTLLIHLGMTGRLWISRHGLATRPHEHLVFELDDGKEMRFADPRRFGMVRVIRSDRLARHPRLRLLGPEPLDRGLTGEMLFRRTRRRKKPIKNFLMDTHAIAGVGNIYACETLFRTGLNPKRQVGRIGPERWDRLVTNLRAVLREAIRSGGTTLRDFANAEEEAGYFAHSLRVYDRQGEPCLRCKSPIRRIVQAGRSTFYCPTCQR